MLCGFLETVHKHFRIHLRFLPYYYMLGIAKW